MSLAHLTKEQLAALPALDLCQRCGKVKAGIKKKLCSKCRREVSDEKLMALAIQKAPSNPLPETE
jgi:hypothetical protein